MKIPALLILLLTASFPLFSQKTKKSEVTRFHYQVNTRISTPQPMDTTLPGSQRHHALYSTFGSWSGLGNNGLPALINQYRPVRNALNPKLFEGFDAYGVNSPDLIFYSSNSPYSLLRYSSGGTADKNGQTIGAIFARNLKNKSNITITGNYINSEGHFASQKCNSSMIRANYLLNRKNYSLVTGIARYSFGFAENGGLESDEELTNASFPNLISVNLSAAATKINFLSWQGVQTWTPGKKHSNPSPSPANNLKQDSLKPDSLPMPRPAVIDSTVKSPGLRLVHTFRIANVTRKYSDAKPDTSFYQNTYSDDRITRDSMKFLSWINDISLLTDTIHIGTHPVLIKGGLNPEFFRYQFEDSINYGYSLGLNGSIVRKGLYTSLGFSGNWVAAGYNPGDFNVTASYSLIPGQRPDGSEISLEVFTRGCSPDPVIRYYRSNHFRWSNDFARQFESGLKIRWNIPAAKASLGANITTNKGWVYFDPEGLPAQLNDRMTVFSLRGTKDFAAGAFRSTLSALAQYSTSDKIRLPWFAGSTSTYMHHDINFKSTGGKLEVEYGLDLDFTTGFLGYAYMPATGIFYAENEKVLGNYPGLNVFAQMKVKRTRIFVAWCETFADLLPQESFAVLHYPSMRPHLKYGFYWHFYD